MPDPPRSSKRRIVVWILFALVAAGALPWDSLRIFTADLPAAREYYRNGPDAADPEFVRFVEGVGERVGPQASIAIVYPGTDWKDGYEWAYYRASYLLAGRRVLPTLWSDGESLLENLGAAEYAIVWKSPGLTVRGFAPVWSDGAGTLLRKTDSRGGR